MIVTNHTFLRILPKFDTGINVAFDSERRVLRCDNGVDWMAFIKISWLYLGFRPEFPFFLVIKSTRTFGSTAAYLASLQMTLIWLLLNGKYSIATSISPLWLCDKKVAGAIRSSFVVLCFFWHELFVAAVFEQFFKNWICGVHLKMRNGF